MHRVTAKPAAEPAPHVGALKLGPTFSGLLYLLLVGSAALALWARQAPGALPERLSVAAPWVFLAFAGFFTLYRLALVKAGKYPAGKAFFQIGTAVLFFMLLLPNSRVPTDAPADPVATLLEHPNAEVRALAAEVARHRPDGEKYGAQLAEALADPDPRVRREAHRSLVQLTGVDLGGPETPGAARAWRERFRGR